MILSARSDLPILQLRLMLATEALARQSLIERHWSPGGRLAPAGRQLLGR